MQTVTIQNVWDIYRQDLIRVEKQILKNLSTHVPAIPMVVKHLLQGGGKRIRPLLLILSSRLGAYNEDEAVILAGIVESIHSASLLHDDVVDGADMRRGKPSAHSIWGNQITILVGDYLYSNALKIGVALKSQRIMDVLSEATTRMTEGELFQLSKIGDPDITEAEYFRIIEAKTGVLISASCRLGAITGRLDRGKEDALGAFGMKLGTAFQMADDILDYMADENKLGKTLGKDLKEGKITIPLIHLLNVSSRQEAGLTKGIIRKEETSAEDLDCILELLRRYKAIDYSIDRARRLIDDAKAELMAFADSDIRDAMLAVADYVLNRER